MQAMLLWLLALARYLWKMEGGPRLLTIASFVSSLTVPFLMMIAGASLAVAAYRPLEDPGVTRAFSDLFYWIADSFVPPVSFGMFVTSWLIYRTQGRPVALPRYTIFLSLLAAFTMPLLWTPFFAKTGIFAANGAVGYFIPMGTWCLWAAGTDRAAATRDPLARLADTPLITQRHRSRCSAGQHERPAPRHKRGPLACASAGPEAERPLVQTRGTSSRRGSGDRDDGPCAFAAEHGLAAPADIAFSPGSASELATAWRPGARPPGSWLPRA